MVEIIKLETLGIEVPHNGEFAFHDEGYLDLYTLYNKTCNLRNGRNLWMLEIANMNFEGIGASDSYEIQKQDKKVRHIHICRVPQLNGKYPLDQFVHAHEETAILEPRNMNRYDLLKKKLTSLGFSCEKFSELKTPHEIEHVGGLSYLVSRGISIGDDSDKNWKALLAQWLEITGDPKEDEIIRIDPEFISATNWLLRNKKD